MKFSRIIGKIDDKLVARAEEKLSQVFLELGTRYNNEHVGSGLGGDPCIFSLIYPTEHVCTLNMPTAATDGKRFYWNPKFVIKQSRIGLRIICAHEAWHALYMHPTRRGSRLPRLWNIAVDYIVNGAVMEDFRARKLNPGDMFTKHLGKYMPLEKYAEMLKNPFGKEYDDIQPEGAEAPNHNVRLPGPNEDRELTPEEQKELERREKPVKFYFADPDMTEDMKSPEKIYDYLYRLLPKCPTCGSVGVYKNPKKNKGKDKGDKSQGNNSGDQQDKDKSQSPGQDGSDSHDHGDGQSCDCSDPNGQGQNQGQGKGCGHGCPDCGDGMDIFGLGGTVDDHMDTEESQEKLAKRISDAMEAARKMAGHVPAALEEELGKLTAPKVTWQDVIRTRLLKARAGNGRNDWTKFRTRPMFAGLVVPKRKSYFANFGCLLDTSGSMSQEDMAYGISQLQGLDERAEGTIVPADSEIYWDSVTKIRKCNSEELSKVKVKGRGGTIWAPFFADYEKYIGKCDFLVIISDLYLLDQDVAEMRDPGIDVFWLCTSTNAGFKPPFGRVLPLRD